MRPVPALTDEQVVSTVTWLAGADIPQGDPRFGASYDEALSRILAGRDRSFAVWPDGALAYVAVPQPTPADIVAAYRGARAHLEALAPSVRLDLAAAATRHWPAQPASTIH